MSSNTPTEEMFFEAIKNNKSETAIEILKLQQINVNSKYLKNIGETGLHIAAKCGNVDLVKLMVNEFNADINIKDNNNESPLVVACDNYQPKIAKFLVEKNAADSDYAKSILNEEQVDQLFEAAENNDITRVKELLDQKVVNIDVVDKSQHNRSVLQAAALHGHEELVEMLVEKYNANIQWTDDIGDLSVHMAADHGHLGVVKYLVNKGSRHSEDVNHLL